MKYEKDTPNYMDTILTQQQRELITKQDSLIKDALIRNGVDVNDMEFLKRNLSRIIIKGGEFDDYYLYYGTDKQVRILSIQIRPVLTTEYSDNKFSISATLKYY